MDLNADGNIDILSGSFSATKDRGPQAGLFKVFWGTTGGGYMESQTLSGADGKALIITVEEGSDIAAEEQTCTRAYSADLDGDGYLDIVSGNRAGSFALFRGAAGNAFSPTSSWLKGVDAQPLTVGGYSDPYLVDWDGDGDLDLLSGSGAGGVWIFPNIGSPTAPNFGPKVTLVKTPAPLPNAGQAVLFGDEHLVEPQGSTRVAVADVDGDGRLDLLIGDTTTLNAPAAGLTEEHCLAKLAEWEQEFELIKAKRPEWTDEEGSWEIFDAWQTVKGDHIRAQAEFLQRRGTGSVWLLRQVDSVGTTGERVRDADAVGTVPGERSQEASGDERAPRVKPPTVTLEPTAKAPLDSFVEAKTVGERTTVTVHIEILEGWHAYDFVGQQGQYTTVELELVLPVEAARVGEWKRPASESYKNDPFLQVFEGYFAFSCEVEGLGAGKEAICKLAYQVCNDQLCMPPTTEELKVTVDSQSKSKFEAPMRLEAGGEPIFVESPGYGAPSWFDVTADGIDDLVLGQFAGGKVQIFPGLKGGGLDSGRWLEVAGKVAEVPGVW